LLSDSRQPTLFLWRQLVIAVSAFKPALVQENRLNLAWWLPNLFQVIGITLLTVKDQSSIVVNIAVLATLSLNNLLDKVAQLFNGHCSDGSLGIAFRHGKHLASGTLIFAASDFAWRCQNLQRLSDLEWEPQANKG
jgi:hypothetical protein